MEIPSRAGSSWRRRDLLRLFAAAPAVVALSTACTAEPKQPDALLALATDTGVRIPGVPALPLDGYEDAARLIFSCVKRL